MAIRLRFTNLVIFSKFKTEFFLLLLIDNKKNQITNERTNAAGFPVGFVGDPQENPGSEMGLNYIYNHVNIKVSYHTDPDIYEGRRIVGFEVEPESIAHSLDFSPDDPKQVYIFVYFLFICLLN